MNDRGSWQARCEEVSGGGGAGGRDCLSGVYSTRQRWILADRDAPAGSIPDSISFGRVARSSVRLCLPRSMCLFRSSTLMPRPWIIACIVGIAGAPAGCDRGELAGPPTLHPGKDDCAECGMLINEDRCSSGLLIDRNGVREHIVFDDIGCMLEYEHAKHDGVKVIDRFVHDHKTKAWVASGTAFFLYADPEKLSTPMGSGIVAFADRAAAEQAQREFGGDVMDFTLLVPARRAWMEARYGKPKEQP